MKLFTIGFTRKTAKQFFELLFENHVDLLIDVRINNKSQLAGFAKDPDLAFLLERICGIGYIHDTMFAPTEQILKQYRAREISWEQYESAFDIIMKERKIEQYIQKEYSYIQDQSVVLLCSEPTADHCHRRLVANRFSSVFHPEVIHL